MSILFRMTVMVMVVAGNVEGSFFFLSSCCNCNRFYCTLSVPIVKWIACKWKLVHFFHIHSFNQKHHSQLLHAYQYQKAASHIHKIIVRPKYLHRRTIYCFDVWCCVGYYAKRLAHIIDILYIYARAQTITFHVSKVLLSCHFFRRISRRERENAHFNKATRIFFLFFLYYACYSDSFRSYFFSTPCTFFFLNSLRFLYFCWCKWPFFAEKKIALKKASNHRSFLLKKFSDVFGQRKWEQIEIPKRIISRSMIWSSLIPFVIHAVDAITVVHSINIIHAKMLKMFVVFSWTNVWTEKRIHPFARVIIIFS